MFIVINKYTGRKVYEGSDKAEAKKAYKKDFIANWVYFDGKICDLRTFKPKA